LTCAVSSPGRPAGGPVRDESGTEPRGSAGSEGRIAATGSIWLRAGFFAVFVVLVAARIPGILAGRFWAEDGLFLVDAERLPWLQALLQQHTGYLDLIASTTMLLATRLVALENAPLVSLAVSLCVQVLPGLLLATGGIRSMRNPLCLGAALLILATVPVADEVWLSPITSQYHLIVAVAIVLASETGRGWSRWLYRGVLLLAPFAGPGPSLVAPLFFLRALRDRRWERVLQAALISAGTLVQIGVLFGHPVQDRGFGLAPDLLLMVVAIKHILVPLLLRSDVLLTAVPLMHAWQAAPRSTWPLLAMAGAAIVLVVFGIAAWRSRSDAARWLYLAAVLAMVLSYAGSLGTKELLLNFLFGERYYVAPQMLFGLSLIAIAASASVAGRVVAGGFVMWLIVIGAAWYANPEPVMASGPDWRDQVAAWRANPAHALVLWPPGFSIMLPAVMPADRFGFAGSNTADAR
jgi:hypothetical protein